VYHRLDDTIAALASAPGGAARGIVRLSGPGAVDCVESIFAADDAVRLHGVAGARTVAGRCPLNALGTWLPCTVYLWPGTRSYTRQPLAELHTLGSPPLLKALLEAVCAAGARLAEPGEFTLRAFLAGRIDLTQAEAVLGVIDAAGRSQLEIALAQLAGGLSEPLSELRERLLNLLADLEAGLDFVDEDIHFISCDELHAEVSEAATRVQALLDQISQRAMGGDEPVIVLVGLPNAGKSSLLNALAGEAAAIVSPQAGTTRDYVTKHVSILGLTCELVDTAGVEQYSSPQSIAALAQRQSGRQSQRAEVQLLCIDGSREASAWERQEMLLDCQRRIPVLTKTDLCQSVDRKSGAIATSSVTGQGLNELRAAIAQKIALQSHDASRVVAATAARSRASLEQALASLQAAQRQISMGQGDELIAAHLREALNELGHVVGAVYTDDILDRIFSRFCIGK
jgi:tRNA modification GTPase